MLIKAPAKINLTLDVTGKRKNGYHDIKMIMQTVSLYDNIFIEKDDKISVKSNLDFLPTDESNIAFKAAKSFFEYTKISGGAKIVLEKSIPVGAGLAGGSTNAAAVINGLDQLYETKLEKAEKEALGAKLGADVVFFFTGGTALAEGIGEIITPINPMPECHIVIVKPKIFVSTKMVYQNLKLDEIKRHPDTELVIQMINEGNLRKMTDGIYNVLETVTGKKYPIINKIKKEMCERGALTSIMSGSGSAVFGIFDDLAKAQSCAAAMSAFSEISVCVKPI